MSRLSKQGSLLGVVMTAIEILNKKGEKGGLKKKY